MDQQQTSTSGSVATDKTGTQVVQGSPHQPLPGERKLEKKTGEIDMNPGEPVHPFEPFNQQQAEEPERRQPA